MSLPHGGNIYHYSAKYKIPVEEFLDFSASVNPLGPSPMAVKALKGVVPSLVNYPDPDCRRLVGVLSERLGVRRGALLAGNGSTELIYLLPRVIRPRRALVFAPAFSDYERACRLAGAGVKALPLKEEDGFLPDMDALFKALRGVDLFFICNPNNPTGVALEKARMLDILRLARKAGAFTVLDEAFIEYTPGESALREVSASRDAAVMRNFTKFYGMPGLRAGYLAAHPAVIEKLADLREPWSVNTLAEHAAAAAVMDEPFARRSLTLMARERPYLHRALGALPGLAPYAASANFMLARLPETGPGADDLTERLAPLGILIRSCSNFRGLGDRFIRVAVKTRAENAALVKALKGLL